MRTLTPLNKDIIFQFIDSIDRRGFFKQNIRGFIVAGEHGDSAGTSRWVKVVAYGPKVAEFLRQDHIELLVENLRWTKGEKFDGETIWKTDETQVLAYRINHKG